LKRTPLFELQKRLNPRWAPFSGWELPVYYSSILKEHQAVRTAAGLFDVSHLGHLEVSGSGAVAGLNRIVTQDLGRLGPGQALYTPICSEAGAILDEMILYRLAADRVRLVVNAANGDKILDWLRQRLTGEAETADLREDFGTLALQGPRALEILAGAAGKALAAAPRYTVRPGRVAGVAVWLARTGYTGEDGCELFVPASGLGTVWNHLLETGASAGLEPVGLGARDTLRLEAGLPLGGSDLDERTTPLEAGLEWTIGWAKGPFIGREALEKQERAGAARRLSGFRLTGAGVARHGCPILSGGKPVGVVTSGTLLPPGASGQDAEKRPIPPAPTAIGLGYLPPALAVPGTAVEVELHGRRAAAEIVKLPFYRRKRGA